MITSLQVAKAVLPDRTGKFLRRKHRAWVFDRAMRRFLTNPCGSWQERPELLSDLIYGWGNESFSAREEYLAACLRHALLPQTAVLECGSGLTTLLVGAILQQKGSTLCSLEHDPDWRARVRAALVRFRIGCVRVVFAPLTDYGGYSWYGPDFEALPWDISLVICDGPPADTPGGRYGAIPQIRERLLEGAVVLLDDAGRAEERRIVARWADELGRGFEIFGEEKPYARIAT
ncbi:MAG TPA: hypothetical protein VE046_07280 [Steroidobacteraceae bacterium]|nr:hypothetical protein [Steroidobacteraceae bacterium]